MPMSMWDELEALEARVYLGLREGGLVADDVVTLACHQLEWGGEGYDSPAVAAVVERHPDSVPPAELAVLAQQILDASGFEPGLGLAPETADVLREALVIVARDLPATWTAAGPPRIRIDPNSYPVTAKVEFADGWRHGEGMQAGPPDDLAGALVTVGEHVLESVMERHFTVWPVCPEHRLGVHAVASSGGSEPGRTVPGVPAPCLSAPAGTVVWFCNGTPGGHPVASIGSLNSRRVNRN